MRGVLRYIVGMLPVVDVLALAALLAFLLHGKGSLAQPGNLLILLLSVPLTQFFSRQYGVYDSHRLERPLEVGRSVLLAHLSAALAVLAGSQLLTVCDWQWDIGYIFGSAAILLAVVKTSVYAGLRMLRRRGFDQRNVLLVGAWAEAESFAAQLQARPEWGLRLDCVLPTTPAPGGDPGTEYLVYPGRRRVATTVEELLEVRVIDEVVISVQQNSPGSIFEHARRFAPYGLQVRVVFRPFTSGVAALPRAEEYAGAASLDIAPARLDARSLALKRGLDIALSAALLILTSPLLALVSIVIRLTSAGPVFFVQTRVGLNGRRFRMHKFRTMVDGSEFHVQHLHRSITRGPVFKDARDYRVTPIGRFLRRFSLDELPQLLDVLRGDMSLVGPRPLPVAEAARVTGEYRRRFSVLPGLTCIWQVSGRSDIAYDRWMQYDLQYIDGWSLWFDAVLLFRTIPAVLSGRGAY